MPSKDKEKNLVSFHEFREVFAHVNTFGRYQKALFLGCNGIILAFALQYGSLLFSFGTPRFHCADNNSTCEPNKCCNNCTTYAFDGPFISIVNEWSLLCDRRYIAAIVQSMFFAGQLVGSSCCGMVSDAFGRKRTMLLSSGLFASFSLGASFANGYILLGFLEFMVGFFLVSALLSEFTYVIELSATKRRTMIGSVVEIFWPVCLLLHTLIAFLVHEWRNLLLAVSIPGFVFVCFWRYIPESPRWLVTRGRLDEAQAVLNRFGSSKPIDQQALRGLIESIRESQIETERKAKRYTVIDLYRTPKMRKWVLVMGFNWFTVQFSDMGFMLFLSVLPGSVYVNQAIPYATQVVLIPIVWVLMQKFGRRPIHVTVLLVPGVMFLVLMAIPEGYPMLSAGLALTSKSILNIAWLTIYLIGSEVFPTTIRSTALGMCSTFQRCGALVAGYVSMLSQLPGLSIYLPVTIYGLFAIAAGVLFAIFIPETLHATLAQTIEEAETRQDSYALICCAKPASADVITSPVETEANSSV
ncbi:organic cation transporter protein [Nematostella vectensis]|uniref:organic cation transporter protein n=1 Tax=Nematostella vectensis TaxID=45351 RepID=UPI0020779AE8|nr:organic cation transporter protein [Nematostella vectensis]